MNRLLSAAARAAVLAALTSCGASVIAAPTVVPGTHVTIDPPEGFTPADRFSGFQRPESSASIMVTELPTPAAELRKAMTREGFAARGMMLLAAEPVKAGGQEALLLRVMQKAGATSYFKWMLVTGNDRQTVMVVATYPQAASAEWGAVLRRAVLSTVHTPDALIDPWAGLPFRFVPGQRLKIANRVGNSLVLTESGRLGQGRPDEVVYVVGSSVADPDLDDLQAFSEQRAADVPQVRNLGAPTGRALTVDGLEAYELVAGGEDAKSGEPVRLYQTVVKEPGGYVIFLGLAGEKVGDAWVEVFRGVTGTFRRLSNAR